MSDEIKCCGLTWKDTTSYSQGQERIPTCWSVRVGDFHITVVSSHIHYPGKWISHCEPLWECWDLETSSREETMAKSVAMLRDRLTKALKAMPEEKSK